MLYKWRAAADVSAKDENGDEEEAAGMSDGRVRDGLLLPTLRRER
jgi:hypothetical protein